MVSVLGSKLATMFLTGAVSIILGLIPLKFKGCIQTDSIRHRTIISGLLCLGGGVLLAVAMIHVLPEVRENLESALGTEAQKTPYAEIIFCCGFFLSYFIEEFVHFACDSGLHHNEKNCGETHDSESVAVHKTFSQNAHACEVADQQLECNTPERRSSGSIAFALDDSTRAGNSRTSATRRTKARASNGYNTFQNQDSASPTLTPTSSTTAKTNSVKNILTIIALSTHAVFEGLIVGLEATTSAVWTLFSAVALHKYVISFCVGVELFSQQNSSLKMNICYIITYALMSPIGIAIGIAMTSGYVTINSTFNLAIGIIQGVASGTLMYVIVFEVFQREKAKEEILGIIQLAFVIIGFVAMLTVELTFKHEH